MIRFRTIEPETAGKADEAPATAPRPEQAPLPGAETRVRSKGLARKTPRRAGKPAPAQLFQE